jgi:hypothetical protein
VQTGEKLMQVTGHNWAYPVCIDITGKKLITSSTNHTAHIWEKYKADAYTIDQLRLLFLLYRWIFVEKPCREYTPADKAIVRVDSADKFIVMVSRALAPT